MPHCQNSSKFELLDHRNRGKIDTLLHTNWYPITYKLIPYYIQTDTLLHTNWYPIKYTMIPYCIHIDTLLHTNWYPITYKLIPYYIHIYTLIPYYIQIRVITKLPNSEQFYKGKVKTQNYTNRQNQSTTGKLKTVMTLICM